MNLCYLLCGCFFNIFFDFVIDDFFFGFLGGFFLDNFLNNFLFNLFDSLFFERFLLRFFGFCFGFFDNFFNLFVKDFLSDFFYCFLNNGIFYLGSDFFGFCLDGLFGRLGKNLDSASLLGNLCRISVAVVTLGVVTFGCANGFVCGCSGGCGSGSHGSLLCNGFLDDGFFFDNLFCNGFFDNGFFFDDFFDGFFHYLGLIVIKLPGEVCVCGNNGFVFLYQLRYVVGIKFKGSRRLFFAQIFANKSTRNECFGIGKGILLLVVDLFDIDGRKSLLFASSLYQLESQGKLTGRVDLIKEGGFGIFLFAAYILAAINGILKRRGFKSKIKIKCARADIDFCDLCVLVCVSVDGPAHALLGAFVAHKRVADSTVILFGVGARLHQFCLAALAIACHDVATRFLVKANDTLVAKEIAFVIVIVLFCIGFSFSLIFNLSFVLGIDFINLDLFILGFGKCGGAFAIFDRTFNSDLAFHTELGLELHEFGDRLHHLLGSRAELLALTLGDGGGVGFFDDFLCGFDDVFFNDGSLSRIGRSALGNNGVLNRMNHRDFGILCNHCRFNNLCFFDCFFHNLFDGFFNDFFNNFLFGLFDLFDNFFLVFLGHNGILGCNQVGDSLLCRLVALVIVDIVIVIIIVLSSLLLFCSSCRRFFCSSCGSFLCRLLSSLLSLLCLFCRLCGNQQISLGIQNDQEQTKNKRTNCSSNSQHQKGQLRRGRNRAKGKRRYCVVRSPVVIVFILRQVELTAACTTQFANEHTNACNFGTENTCQSSNGNVINVFYTQPD